MSSKQDTIIRQLKRWKPSVKLYKKLEFVIYHSVSCNVLELLENKIKLPIPVVYYDFNDFIYELGELALRAKINYVDLKRNKVYVMVVDTKDYSTNIDGDMIEAFTTLHDNFKKRLNGNEIITKI